MAKARKVTEKKKTRFRAEEPVAIEEVAKRAQKKGEKFNGWGSDLSNQNRGNSLPEIQHMRHLLDIMERNINGRLTAQDAIDLRDNIDNWNEDAKKLGEMVMGLDIDIAALLEKDANTKETSISNSNASEEEYEELVSYTEEDDEEFNEQLSSFVENMVECVDDFIAKISS
ncbi:MAG: hypothetical protein HFH39_13450 [Lachnospiraceae bacterium]|nr:hypothetical protein [Lachnospiraceae bacterium]